MPAMRPLLASLLLLLIAAFAPGQAVDEKADKVSNDQPDRPLQMPPASTEVKEAFDDFERFKRRNAWERALKALFTIPDEQTTKFVDGEGGFIISVAQKRRAVLSSLPPEGQAAYRLFYDADAKKLLDEADGSSEKKNLERVYSAYFASSVGDNAADRLGDLNFELGHFDRAAECWLSIVRERPDTDLSIGLVSLKAALALYRAGRMAELAQVRTDLAERHADEKVTLGGRSGSPAEVLRLLLGEEGEKALAGPGVAQATPVVPAPDLGDSATASWQMRFADSVEAGMTPAELVQWQATPLSLVVPAVAVDGSNIYANYLGTIFAIDARTGKLLWRSGTFHHVDLSAMQQQVQFMDTSRFAVVASGESVWTLGRDLKDQNYMAPFGLTCRRATNGDVIWNSTDLSDYVDVDLVGQPLLVGETLFVAAKSGMNQRQQGKAEQFLVAIRGHDGKLLWKAELGALRSVEQYWNPYQQSSSTQPQLFYRAGSVYVDTHLGVLARVTAETGAIDWGFGYRTDPVQGQNRFFFFNGNMQVEPAGSGNPPLAAGELLLIKGAQSDRLYAVDPNTQKLAWERPIARSTRLLAAGAGALYLGGPELGEMNLETRKLGWSSKLPGGSLKGKVLARPDGIWQLTHRGIFEIDPRTGDTRRIIRGDDLGVAGGDLIVTDRMLVSVSNRTISVYDRRAAGAGVASGGGPGSNKARASNE
ncbi:PQQ-binding-like beta-propeller repeat protein [Isosphaeraceae bacterium EP7]